MTQHRPRPAPRPGDPERSFEIRIVGSVADEVLAQLAGVEATTRELRTSLRIRLRDQSELHGLLARLRTYGLEVVEVRRLADGPAEEPGLDEEE